MEKAIEIRGVKLFIILMAILRPLIDVNIRKKKEH